MTATMGGETATASGSADGPADGGPDGAGGGGDGGPGGRGGRVRLLGLGIRYGDVPVVDGLDLDLPAGRITVLLGPSGCGKSTILRAIAGLLAPTTGGIDVDGSPVDGTSSERAMAFQEDALLPWRSALANVELALALRGIARRQRRATAIDLLGQVGLGGSEHLLPRQLSGGMRQRVQLARTLAVEPRVMLMDEPFGALDAQTRGTMQRLLVDVWDRHRTTIAFVTHDVDEALTLADRIVVMSASPARVRRVVEVGSPRAPGGRFATETTRLRYELLACLGETDGSPGPDGTVSQAGAVPATIGDLAPATEAPR